MTDQVLGAVCELTKSILSNFVVSRAHTNQDWF